MAVTNNDISNAAESSCIGMVVSFILNILLPWAGHTIGAIITGLIVAYCVFKFNKWIKKDGNSNL
jgi:fructose-specific phosphotransferase system IIC component